MRRLILFLLAVLSAAVISCSPEKNSSVITVMSWNVQNLFDDVDNGSEYREFDPSNGEWNNDLFNRKAAALADVITASVAGYPDIVLLQEIENGNALDLLNNGYLKTANYKYSFFFPTEGSAIGLGVLSRMPVLSINNHGVFFQGLQAGRNIAEIDFEIPYSSEKLRIYLNHWKSKLGGAGETEPLRIAAAEVLSRLAYDTVFTREDFLVVAAGDFNESHDEYDRIGGAYPTAVREYSGDTGADPPSGDGFFFSGESALMRDEASSEKGYFYNPWPESECPGSYFYNDNWETIDQFFISGRGFNGTGLEYAGFETVDLELNSTREGRPSAWVTSSATGCSDHFPVILRLDIID